MLAAEQGSLDIVQELIRRGANVNLDDVVSAHIHTRQTNTTPAPFFSTAAVVARLLATNSCFHGNDRTAGRR